MGGLGRHNLLDPIRVPRHPRQPLCSRLVEICGAAYIFPLNSGLRVAADGTCHATRADFLARYGTTLGPAKWGRVAPPPDGDTSSASSRTDSADDVDDPDAGLYGDFNEHRRATAAVSPL